MCGIHVCGLYQGCVMFVLECFMGQLEGTALFVLAPQPPSLPGSPHSRSFLMTHNDAPQSVRLPWTSDLLEKGQLVEGIIILLVRSVTLKDTRGVRAFGNRVPRKSSGLFKDTVSH